MDTVILLSFIFAIVSGGVYLALAPPPRTDEERDAAVRATMLSRLKASRSNGRATSRAVLEYWADRYRHEHVGHWARVSFEHYLADPDNAEAVTRARRAAEAIRHAELAAALDLRGDLLPRAVFALN